MKRICFTIFASTGLLLVIGFVLSSCAVPLDVSTQRAATVAPASSPATPVTSQPVATPASPTKPEGESRTATPKPKREGIPDTPVNHIGRTACIACHASGVSDIPPLPSDHSGRNDTTCIACHRQAGLQPVPAKAPVEKINGFPALPSDHAGRTICAACHSTGAGGATRLPADHAGRNDATCAACHKASSTQPPATTPPPVTTQPPTPAGKEDRDTGKKEGPPALPAMHQGRTSCNVCHESGLSGAPKNPQNHSGRADATCAACHKQDG